MRHDEARRQRAQFRAICLRYYAAMLFHVARVPPGFTRHVLPRRVFHEAAMRGYATARQQEAPIRYATPRCLLFTHALR